MEKGPVVEAAPMPMPASQSTMAQSPEAQNLRQRQRDRLSPRGRLPKSGRISTTVREVDSSAAPKTGITLSPAPRSREDLRRAAGKRSPDLSKKKQLKEGLRKESSVLRKERREAEDGRFDITPDGGSAGREGRQFTVANVGNNGRIYLRPTIRPANQRYPQPSFVFPITPPSTAGLDVLASRNDDDSRASLWTPTRTPSTPVQNARKQYFPETQAQSSPRLHRRAFSNSTIEESIPIQGSDMGAFKVVIERPGTGVKPKPAEYSTGLPTLDVAIPSFKLGTPRFSLRGTAFLRNSSYTGTDDMRSSVLSSRDHSIRQSSRRPTRLLSRRHSDASPQPYSSATRPSTPMSTGTPFIGTPGAMRHHVVIVPEMFDALTFKPACDHPSVVRYSVGGGIKAATPARLVAEITSPTFVDYDLLSDFFLTYRAYLDTSDLLHMLIARLRWALERDDETGTVVRVRTFVAMRHWILNYFLDDYVIDYDLRKSFCELLNGLVDDVSNDPTRTKVPLKILGELKKCWRRVCALYWDGEEFDTELGAEGPIHPGGIAGHRNPKLDPSFWETHPDGPPQLEGIIEPDFVEAEPESAAEQRNFFADVSRAGHIESMMPDSYSAHQTVPTVQVQQDNQEDEPPLSPGSIMSEDFVSCSFPSRSRPVGTGYPLAAHPVVASSLYENGPPIATTPRALTGKRVRPNHAHKRSGSFSDSFRDQRIQPVEKVLYRSTELLLALPYAGSLVRGNLFPPGQAFVEEIAPGTPADANRATTLFPGTPANQKGPSAMSGPGMKKLLGSVRRALSTRNISSPSESSPTQGSFPHIPPLGVRGATINRLPGTAIVPQARPRNTGARAPMRIDLLGAEIAEDFKRAVREDAEADMEQREANERESAENSERNELHYSEMHPDTTIESLRPDHQRAAPSEVTTGSKSIVIVDDTLNVDLPTMTGALPMNRSVDTFADAFMQPSGGPTPPCTPPEVPLGTPRRSSHLLGLTRNRSPSIERTPSLVTDFPGSHDRSPINYKLFSQPSLRSQRSYVGPSRPYSYRVKKSSSLRRYASYQSGMTREQTERSFDASSFAESNKLSNVDSVPRPLRVLRRRPGGDLRAVNNVGDLNEKPLRRTMSTGSLATFSDSVRSSFMMGGDSSDYVGVVSSDYDDSKTNAHPFSLGQLAQPSPKPRVSLFSTHSSQPVMRPSFEKEAAMLAQIPDDANDDGGVESALLKLEGKFEQRRSDGSTSNMPRDVSIRRNSFGGANIDVSTLTLPEDDEEKHKHRLKHIVETNISKTPSVESYRPDPHKMTVSVEELKPVVYQPRGMQQAPIQSPRSVESYSSIPLLERGLSVDNKGQQRTHDWTSMSSLRAPSNERLEHNEHIPESSHPSYEFVNETESMRGIGETEADNESFLGLDDSDDRSDLSSEMSLEVISRTEYTAHDSNSTSAFPPLRAGTIVKEMALPLHPLHHPPSPPMTLVQALQLSPNTANIPQLHDNQIRDSPKGVGVGLPPTPDITPTLAMHDFGERGASPSTHDPLRMNSIPDASRKTSVHLPFTLAFDSQVLAQQFTLIEKDALNEIDWKDLIEMRWKDTQTESRSWVEFLRTSEPRGVEVVIARFNLMVKWAVSEIVLTSDLEERVRCIMKFIHIAAHCRRYRNFATMTQLTVALTSKDISRLTHTWNHVPAADMQTLGEMEALVTPTSNFHSLRAEMEGSGADQGCIPFVGIYTHDLLVNSERPSQIASTPTTEPLVNFERCRTDATIVKNLLRLLEASQLYRFLPIEGVTERCLWMAALSDSEIARYGKMIEA